MIARAYPCITIHGTRQELTITVYLIVARRLSSSSERKGSQHRSTENEGTSTMKQLRVSFRRVVIQQTMHIVYASSPVDSKTTLSTAQGGSFSIGSSSCSHQCCATTCVGGVLGAGPIAAVSPRQMATSSLPVTVSSTAAMVRKSSSPSSSSQSSQSDGY